MSGTGYAQGYNQFNQDQTRQDYLRSLTAQMLQAHLRQQQQDAARKQVGNVLYNLIGAPPGTGRGPQPPEPGQASTPMTPAPTPPAAPVGMAPPPYQAVPTPPAGGEGGGVGGEPETAGGGEIPAPPQAEPTAAAPAAPGGAVVPAGAPAPAQRPVGQPLNVRGFVQQMKKNGVPPEFALDMLDAVAPRLNDQSQMDLKLMGIENATLKQAQAYYMKQVEALRKERDTDIKGRRADIHEKDVDSKIEDRNTRNDIRERDLQRKLQTHVGGGTDNLKRTEFEKDGEGNIIGVTGITKSGKIVRLDADGNERAPGGTPANPKADQNRMRQVNSWRSQLSTLLNITAPTKEDRVEIERLKKNLRDAGQSDVMPGARKPAAAGPRKPAPPVGTKQGGYEFTGGDPADRKNWKKVDAEAA